MGKRPYGGFIRIHNINLTIELGANFTYEIKIIIPKNLWNDELCGNKDWEKKINCKNLAKNTQTKVPDTYGIIHE